MAWAMAVPAFADDRKEVTVDNCEIACTTEAVNIAVAVSSEEQSANATGSSDVAVAQCVPCPPPVPNPALMSPGAARACGQARPETPRRVPAHVRHEQQPASACPPVPVTPRCGNDDGRHEDGGAAVMHGREQTEPRGQGPAQRHERQDGMRPTNNCRDQQPQGGAIGNGNRGGSRQQDRVINRDTQRDRRQQGQAMNQGNRDGNRTCGELAQRNTHGNQPNGGCRQPGNNQGGNNGGGNIGRITTTVAGNGGAATHDDNGHGNDAGHTDSSNPGQGNGNHGTQNRGNGHSR